MMAYLSTIEDSLLKQSSVLELGSGCGAVGMYAALRGLCVAYRDDPQVILFKGQSTNPDLVCTVCLASVPLK